MSLRAPARMAHDGSAMLSWSMDASMTFMLPRVRCSKLARLAPDGCRTCTARCTSGLPSAYGSSALHCVCLCHGHGCSAERMLRHPGQQAGGMSCACRPSRAARGRALVPCPTCRLGGREPHGVQRHTVAVGNCSGRSCGMGVGAVW